MSETVVQEMWLPSEQGVSFSVQQLVIGYVGVWGSGQVVLLLSWRASGNPTQPGSHVEVFANTLAWAQQDTVQKCMPVGLCSTAHAKVLLRGTVDSSSAGQCACISQETRMGQLRPGAF